MSGSASQLELGAMMLWASQRSARLLTNKAARQQCLVNMVWIWQQANRQGWPSLRRCSASTLRSVRRQIIAEAAADADALRVVTLVPIMPEPERSAAQRELRAAGLIAAIGTDETASS
jgi:hypothetical protein